MSVYFDNAIANVFAESLPLCAYIVTNHMLINYSLSFIVALKTTVMLVRMCLFESLQIELALCELKLGNAPGADGVMAEHIVYAYHIISLHLFALFNAILKHSYVPSQFGTGITIPSLKDTSLDPSGVSNYSPGERL